MPKPKHHPKLENNENHFWPRLLSNTQVHQKEEFKHGHGTRSISQCRALVQHVQALFWSPVPLKNCQTWAIKRENKKLPCKKLLEDARLQGRMFSQNKNVTHRRPRAFPRRQLWACYRRWEEKRSRLEIARSHQKPKDSLSDDVWTVRKLTERLLKIQEA